ncbi:hypothetical protein GGD65_007966 [Bradyrhizobium sp. CIR18]|uniref:hypothetical protein n=1 Tax=unclassified Bradyrhizobium TaxID=2631580 RepID=UPI0015CCD84C|nr:MULTISPECIES: hypothetical protein [unclassified Bradyrhizobium]MBB4366892.1 hypothetical protein [Bradyrhizobium sp. CIR18]NYG45627.1 hypothetical protein [Bradyrhizobium sp. IAR9]
MSLSIGLIVDGYVKLNNRSALENLLAHRRELLQQLNCVTGVDPKPAIAQVSQDITVIERALAALAQD